MIRNTIIPHGEDGGLKYPSNTKQNLKTEPFGGTGGNGVLSAGRITRGFALSAARKSAGQAGRWKND
jgi:hypothetical protein